ncbi:MAG: hypothetical protein DCC71_21020, partial [Proteobacteria bacterium]
MSPPGASPTAPRVRDALLAHAERIAVVPLTLVVSPAGSGKSTLLDAWQRALAAHGQPTAYLDLSPLHADASVLVADLREPCAHAAPGFGAETLAALALPPVADTWRSLARAWLRDAAKLEAPLVLFVDNFHELPHEASGARWLDEVIRASSGRCAVVVSTRGSVPGCAARLRADGAVLDVGAQDLSLRFDEVRDVLAAHGAGADAEVTARVLARTGGWATGVQLAARRLAQVEPAARAAFALRLAREPDLFGFVANEVLRDEPAEALAVLDAVALLGRCAPADAAELLGDPRAGGWIGRAVERGLLLSDGDEVWVHQLWRDLLNERAAQREPPAARAATLQRA